MGRARPFVLAAPLLAAALLLAACGGGGGSDPAPVTVRVTSSYGGDGDVVRFGDDPGSYALTTPPGGDVVYVGLDDVGGGVLDEYVAILDFPLDNVRSGASIVSASLGLSYVCEAPGFTLRAELVDLLGAPLTSYDPSVLWDNTTAPLETIAAVERELPSTSSAGARATLDVTPLMAEAQRLDLPRLQLRLALSGSDAAGLAAIDDPFPGGGVAAPLLEVTFR